MIIVCCCTKWYSNTHRFHKQQQMLSFVVITNIWQSANHCIADWSINLSSTCSGVAWHPQYKCDVTRQISNGRVRPFCFFKFRTLHDWRLLLNAAACSIGNGQWELKKLFLFFKSPSLVNGNKHITIQDLKPWKLYSFFIILNVAE